VEELWQLEETPTVLAVLENQQHPPHTTWNNLARWAKKAGAMRVELSHKDKVL
jgi:uncharacterized protein involved in propanediol utilization